MGDVGDMGVGGGAVGMAYCCEGGVSVPVSVSEEEDEEEASSSQESAMDWAGLDLGLSGVLWEEGERERPPRDASTSGRGA